MSIMEEQTTIQPKRVDEFLSRPLLSLYQFDWEKGIYILLIILTLVSRFWGLGDRVVSHDESLHTHYSFQYFNGDGYQHTPLMHGPFLFHVTAFSYWLFGASDFSARIPVALFGLFLVITPYFLRHWIGRVGALVAAFIMLVSPYSLYYARYIRHDVYVIAWALIIFIATWHYYKNRDDRSLYWFAFGNALMFATKEVSFIYVAIFGSFLILRLLFQIGREPWFLKVLTGFGWPTLLVIGGIGLLGIGGVLEVLEPDLGGVTVTQNEPVAADPNAPVEADAEGGEDRNLVARWLVVLGLFVLSGGLFFIAEQNHEELRRFADFDLIVLYTTFVLPMMAALLSVILGRNPIDYNFNRCAVPNAEALNRFQEFTYRITSGDCLQLALNSSVVMTVTFVLLLLAVSIYVGTWWDARRWVTSAIVFIIPFALLYTSFFSNPWGIMTGTVGSLGYWMEQQEVARGGQPWFYYGVVVPFYEFMPVIFSFVAIRYWFRREGLKLTGRFYGWVLLASLMIGSLVNWYYNEANDLAGDDRSIIYGYATAGVLLAIAIAIRYFGNASWYDPNYTPEATSTEELTEKYLGFVPNLVWWLVFTAVAYTIAGEKMPWLSIHFVIPMAFLVGWYFDRLLAEVDVGSYFERKNLVWIGLTSLLLIAIGITVVPLLIGQVRFGDQTAAGLNTVAQFVGKIALVGGLIYLIRRYRTEISETYRRIGWTVSAFLILSLLTVRFSYLASFPNADYTTEFLVYAHGAPATKDIVMPQLEEMSKRLYGDMRLKIYYDNEASWPYTWYLRDFPSRVYFGENPSPDVRNADAILVGDTNYSKVEPFLDNDFDYVEFTFLWWPMEDYRQISWNAILGDPDVATDARKSFTKPEVREGLWDIFFYRDYNQFGEVMGRNFEIGSWPLKRNMRLYIRRDAKATLWDRGVGATLITPPDDPYAEGEQPFAPAAVFGQGELNRPRNVTVSPDGLIFVADSGNHRIAVFDQAGQLVNSFGGQGTGPGQFNEPWGIVADDRFVYIADTWNNRIQVFDHTGELVNIFGESGSPGAPFEGGGLFYGPRSIVLTTDNQLLVTDTGNHRIQVFNTDGTFITGFGGQGVLPGEFFEPVGLAPLPDGGVVVADTWNERVQEVAVSGENIFSIAEWDVNTWGNSQSIENKPYIAVDGNGRIFVTDPEGYRVVYFDRSGNYLGRFGSYSTDLSGFTLPNGIATDIDGNVYVIDSAQGVLFKFAPPS